MYRPEIPVDAELDGRTRGAKRAKAHKARLTAALGGMATPAQALAIERAAMLLALAEESRGRRLAGDTTITLDDIIRLDGAVRRCLRELGLVSERPRSARKLTYTDVARRP